MRLRALLTAVWLLLLALGITALSARPYFIGRMPLPREQVVEVAAALRAEIVQRVSETGGHLASSLGAVELLTGIHR